MASMSRWRPSRGGRGPAAEGVEEGPSVLGKGGALGGGGSMASGEEDRGWGGRGGSSSIWSGNWCGSFSGPEERDEVPGGPGFPSRVPAAAGPRLPGARGPRRRGRGRGGRGRWGARGGGVPGKGHRPETRLPPQRFHLPRAGGSHGTLLLCPGAQGKGPRTKKPAPAPSRCLSTPDRNSSVAVTVIDL